MSELSNLVPDEAPGEAVKYYDRDFWLTENLNYAKPHFRLQKSARIVTKLAAGQDRSLLDIGCGPATLQQLLPANLDYYGIDIAIQQPAPNLRQANLLETPVSFDGLRFDLVLAQGFFEYMGTFQEQKFAEIREILARNGTFVVSYVNFEHRNGNTYWPYSNVQPVAQFRASIARHFTIQKWFPSCYNWNHTEPNRRLIHALNMRLNASIPVLNRLLAVEYFFLCGR